MGSVLLDTGFLVALLDRSEKNHAQSALFFENFSGSLLSTEPVLTEAIYLCSGSPNGPRLCIEFFLKRAATLVPQSPQSLSRSAFLMEKYRDVPMDFADATLVVLAEETGIDEILTLDLKGFQTYRISGKKPFKILPPR
ncbi:PIN domain-containing protein [bacterium]|nr:PIN domain-containing protein [bacterium]MCI0605743.1 PIN domain-containing protein [bacterium]